MPQKLSRREFAKKATLAASGLALSKTLMAQQPATPPPPPVSDSEIDAATVKLAKPMPDGAREILKADLASQKQDTINRLKISLPENSEPCFRFVVTPKAQKEEVNS